MSEIKEILRAMDDLIGKEATAPLRWQYEQARAQGKVLLPPPRSIEAYGELELGEVIWADRGVGTFGLWDDELPQHIGIFGRSGGGKSNTVFLLLEEFLKAGKPFLIFDWKQTYRGFARENKTRLYTPGNPEAPFYINPLNLNNIPSHLQEGYLRHLLAVLLNVYFRDLQLLSVEGAEYLLLRGLDYLRGNKTVFTFKELFFWMLNYQASFRERDWKSSVLNVLYKLTTGPLGQVLNHEPCVDLKKLMASNTLMELHWLGSPKDKAFLMEIFLLQLYYSFSQEPLTGETKFCIIIEEAHNVLLNHIKGYETVVEMILRQIREYGVSICLIDQHPSLMSLPALGTFCTICFNLRTENDLEAMTSALALDEPICLNALRTGQAIVKLQDRFLKPFLVQFPKAMTHKKTHGSYFAFSGPVPLEKSRIKVISAPVKREDKELKKLLVDIVDHPLVRISERYQWLCFNPRKGNALKDILLRKQLVVPISISTPKGRVKLFELTELGREYLKGEGIKIGLAKRRGSLLHQFWCADIKKRYEKAGFEVKEEYAVGKGKAVDLVAQKEAERIAIEIETGRSDPLGNITKCLEAGFRKVKVVAVHGGVKQKIQAAWNKDDRRVEIMTVGEVKIP
jgi:hypothetical protein